MTAPLRKLVTDLCAHAPPALVTEALGIALAQAGDYQGPEPARMLARLIEDAFAGSRPTSGQINSVSLAVDSAPWGNPPVTVCSFYTPQSAGDRSCYTCGGRAVQHSAGTHIAKETP